MANPPLLSPPLLSPQLCSIQIGRPQTYEAVEGELSDKPWTTALYKTLVSGPVSVHRLGITGDGQAEIEIHGGIDKAICVYNGDHYAYWRSELGLPEMTAGAFGENFTVSDLKETEVCLGDIWRLGEIEVQISQPRQPCWKLARRWRRKDFALRVKENGYTGWYLRVLTEGTVQAGEAIRLVERPLPDWPLSRANEVMHQKREDRDAAVELAAVELLSESWQSQLRSRA